MMGSCLEPPKLEEAAREAMPTFPADVEALMNELNPEQMQVFKKVFAKLIGGKSDGKNDDDGKNNDVGKPLLLMLHGEAGSGKTYLYGKICKAAEMMGIGMVICASTGIAASAIPKCKTVHFAFGLSIFCTTTAQAVMQKELPHAIKNAKLIIIDEISMLDQKVLECVDQKLRKFCENEKEFGGKHVLLGGDRRQLVPPSGKSIYANEPLMAMFEHFELKEQMRQNDPEFIEWLRKIGSGQIKWIKIAKENVVPNMNELIKFVYGEKMEQKNGGGLIIAPTNRATNFVNEIVLEKLEGVEERFDAEDKLAKELDMGEEEEDFSKIPAKTLKLKSGCIVMLLKNLSVDQGLANGTRLVYQSNERSKTLICTDGQGKEHHIPRLLMNQKIKDGFIRRRQFPLRLAYATTIHKGQSQTIDRLGIYMPEKSTMFAEGMPYTAFSRLRRLGGLRLFMENGPEEILLRNKCSPFALAQISEDGKWIPAAPADDGEKNDE